MKIVQTCYAKWLSICSGYCEFNALFYVCKVELSLFFLIHLSYSCLFLCCLLVLPHYMVNKDEYNTSAVDYLERVVSGMN